MVERRSHANPPMISDQVREIDHMNRLLDTLKTLVPGVECANHEGVHISWLWTHQQIYAWEQNADWATKIVCPQDGLPASCGCSRLHFKYHKTYRETIEWLEECIEKVLL